MQKQSEPSFFLAKTSGAAHSVWADSMTFSGSIRSTSCFSRYLDLVLELYGVGRHGRLLESSNSMQCFTKLTRPKWPYSIVPNFPNIWIKLCRYCFYSTAMFMPSFRSRLDASWSAHLICPCCVICEIRDSDSSYRKTELMSLGAPMYSHKSPMDGWIVQLALHMRPESAFLYEVLSGGHQSLRLGCKTFIR